MLDVKRNLTTMTDFYELTMSAGYLDEGYVDKIAVFDMFFRRVPDGGGYAIMAALQHLGHRGRHAHLPAGAYRYRGRPGY